MTPQSLQLSYLSVFFNPTVVRPRQAGVQPATDYSGSFSVVFLSLFGFLLAVLERIF